MEILCFCPPDLSLIHIFIADKTGRSKVLYVTFSMMAIGTLLLAVMNGMSSTLFIVLCIIIYAGMYGGYSMVFSMMDEGGIPLRVSGTAIGLVLSLIHISFKHTVSPQGLYRCFVQLCSVDCFFDGEERFLIIGISQSFCR